MNVIILSRSFQKQQTSFTASYSFETAQMLLRYSRMVAVACCMLDTFLTSINFGKS